MTQSLPAELRDGKIGKIPVWAIGVVIAAVIILFVLWRNRSTDTAQDFDVPPEEPLFYEPGAEGVAGLPPGAIGDYLGSDPTHPAYPVGLTPQGIPGPITNVQWTRLAFDHLIGKGNDPALVERALAKYIAGQNLSAEERAVVNLAQQAFGAPPEGLIIPTPPASTPDPDPEPQPSPQPKPTPKPKQRRYVVVKRYTSKNPPWESTLWGIANHTGVPLDTLKKINGFRPYGSRNPDLIYTGEKIYLDP